METLFLLMIFSLLAIFSIDIRQKRREYLTEGEAEGFVSVTPLQLDLTAYRALTDLNTWQWEDSNPETTVLDNRLTLFRSD